MFFAVIPLFLAANVTVNKTQEWVNGPEFTFHVNMSYLVSMDVFQEPFYETNATAIMKCQQRVFRTMHCRFERILVDGSHETEFERPFLMMFSRRGIEFLMFPDDVTTKQINDIRKIAKELSIGTDLELKVDSFPTFQAKERYVLGECNTTFTVSEIEDTGVFEPDKTKKRNYSLNVLPLGRQEPGTYIVIEKKTEEKGCVKTDSSISSTLKDVVSARSINKKYIGKNIFKSRTEVHLKMKKPDSKKSFAVQDIMTVELVDIGPAKEKITLGTLTQRVKLPYDEEMRQNF
ncbi:uncharacterized protein LOC143180262 [Calliopsis andreniformis]|uniref:uncharacterized protein LOC143180262 n=1 Tax=Calliopsis andreniformis TaxID=337506 RepID=UPI003FCCCD91